eukprot:182164-Chlamydomonas_euryale.AAC.1
MPLPPLDELRDFSADMGSRGGNPLTLQALAKAMLDTMEVCACCRCVHFSCGCAYMHGICRGRGGPAHGLLSVSCVLHARVPPHRSPFLRGSLP